MLFWLCRKAYSQFSKIQTEIPKKKKSAGFRSQLQGMRNWHSSDNTIDLQEVGEEKTIFYG